MAGFMAGFGNTFAGLIESDREYYREAASKRRDYIQTYGTKAVVERENEANAALSTINSLQTAGIDKDALRYVLDTSGVSGIAELANTIKSRDDLTPDQISRMVEVSKDYVATNPDEDINTVVKRAYGLYKATDDPVKREGNIMSAVLGLDSRMMEDDVLNDLYVNGFSGRDIYRIMGSGSPKPGAALELNLPTKRPGMQELNAAAQSVSNKFETSIDAAINSAIRSNDMGLQKELEALKGRGVEGMADYATKYDPSLMDFARIVETSRPGSISGNSINLGTFPTAFTNYWDEQKDDAIMAGGESPTLDEEALAEQAKNAKVGDTIVLDGRPYKVTGKGADGKPNLSPVTAFEAEGLDGGTEEPITEEPVGGLSSRLDGKDGMPTKPVTAEDIRNQTGNTLQTLEEASNATTTFIQEATQTAGKITDRGLAYAMTPLYMIQNAASMSLASILDAAGATESADYLYQSVADNVNGREEKREKGLFATVFEAEEGKDDSAFLDTVSNLFGFNKDIIEDKPELVQAISDLRSDVQRIGTVGFQDLGLREDVRSTEGVPETAADTNLERMEQSRLGRVGVESDRLSTESKSMPDGYIPVQIGATELNLPKVIEGLSVAARGALEKDLKAWSERPTPRGYQPTQIGATELNLPKMLEALKPKTRAMVEKELQTLPETPERRANAARDQRVASEVNRRELTESATRIADMLSRPSSEVSQEELTNFVMEVQAKFGEEAVRAELKRIVQAGQ